MYLFETAVDRKRRGPLSLSLTYSTDNYPNEKRSQRFRCEMYFSNSLILHEVKTSKILNREESLDSRHRFWFWFWFWFYFSGYSLVVVRDNFSGSRKFHRPTKHPEFPQIYSAADRIFKLSSRFRDIPTKHPSLVLIYYSKHIFKVDSKFSTMPSWRWALHKNVCDIWHLTFSF